MDICFPPVTLKHKAKCKSNWITNGIRISSEKLKLLYRLKVTSNSPDHENYYRRYKKVNRKVCAAAIRLENDRVYFFVSNKSKVA